MSLEAPVLDALERAPYLFYIDARTAVFAVIGTPENLVAADYGSIACDKLTGDIYKKTTAYPLTTGWENLSGGGPPASVWSFADQGEIATTEDNWNPTVATSNRVTCAGSSSITGMIAGTPGEQRVFFNDSFDAINLTNEDAASDPENQWHCAGNGTLFVAGKTAWGCFYNDVAQKWYCYTFPLPA